MVGWLRLFEQIPDYQGRCMLVHFAYLPIKKVSDINIPNKIRMPEAIAAIRSNTEFVSADV